MFSGLTSQVSTWMGKKNEDGTDAVPPEEKAASTSGTEGEFDADKKDASPTKGSKLEMLAGVKSQMSGWLSGGIPGLSRGVGGPGGTGQVEGDSQVPISSDTAESQASRESVQGSASEHVKDDDASSATGGADSGPASLEGTPTDDKDGQQAFGAVSTKAIAGAKSLGGFLYSAVNKAGKSVAEASAKIKKTVEENSLLGEFNKEQDAFIASKQGEKGEAVAPWVGAPNEEALREECLALSTDRRNFVRAPPPGVEFVWDFEAAQPVAQATLALDPNLETMRFELVPKVISEENFWRNYFYRVSLLRQSHELNAMASQTESNQNLMSAGSIDHTQDKSSSVGSGPTLSTGTEVSESSSSSSKRSVRKVNYGVEMNKNPDERMESSSSSVTPSNNTSNAAALSSTVETSPAHEFVSDTMRASDTDIREVREGMKKLGMQPPKEEEWERELEAELRDFEVVPAGNNKTTSGFGGKDGGSSTSALIRDDWEEQIDELLGDEDDLK